MKRYFDFSRFSALVRLEIFKVWKGVLFTSLEVLGLLFIGLLIETYFLESNTYDFHTRNFGWIFIVGGFLFSSMAFSDLGSQHKRFIYLNLPASTFEKVLGMWLITSVLWVVLMPLAYTLYTTIVNPIAHFFYPKVDFIGYNPIGDYELGILKYYFVTQSVFLVGAAYFRGFAMAKTVILLVILALVVMALFYFTLKEVFLTEHGCTGMECELVHESAAHGVWVFGKVLFWWVLAPVCWILTYLGLKDQEA